MERKILHIEFQSPVHIGSDIAGIGIENVLHFAHSDTLFSCFINAYALLNKSDLNKCNAMIEKFNTDNPPFKISSSFPYKYESNKIQYFFPKPLINPPQFYGKDAKIQKYEFGKNLKKTTYLSFSDFKAWLLGDENFDLRDIDKKFEKPFIVDLRPHHAQDRLTNSSVIYYVGYTYFSDDGGLFFILEKNKNSILSWDEIKDVWEIAGYYGLGGRRSTGNGIFKIKMTDLPTEIEELFTFQTKNDDFGYITLSLYYPGGELNNLSPVAFDFVKRKGWTFSVLHQKQMKRKICTMFTEGSVFKNKPIGQLVDVTPKGYTNLHNVYRLGQPICLPIKIFNEVKNE
ncbi:type III-A CRISPR-associated RAMP protein Csm4 [Tenuifilum sp.]|uniref:type III-A CRISPR-associated RAMP protein Csm4 n=1 Tax=Tenuifilum sp. TaxID=2760880 RepID=UPI002BA53491|nr:type III-A CRISPR-associated RAMP protein Csm4 [Bacteroidales bacterium]HPP89766.1 type III-A CRISPR-associated RAMP protein Csm4 [Tenuifilum sp.]